MKEQSNPLLREIEPGETFVWHGKPELWPFVMMGPLNKFVLVPFSVFWAGFFIFIEVQMIAARSTIGATLVFPFVVLGLYLVVGRFLAGIRCWKNTFYLVTNRRIIIQTGTLWLRIIRLDLSAVPSVTLQIVRAGIGHVNFAGRPVFDSIYIWQPGPSAGISEGRIVKVPGFRYIRQPEWVFRTICGLREGTHKEDR